MMKIRNRTQKIEIKNQETMIRTIIIMMIMTKINHMKKSQENTIKNTMIMTKTRNIMIKIVMSQNIHLINHSIHPIQKINPKIVAVAIV